MQITDSTYTEYKYDAFGEITNGAPLMDNPFTYCGEYTDSETELVYLRNRYYDPSIGRFISEDPIKDGLNWYAYCGNDPVNAVDPWGLEIIVVSGSEENSRYKYNFIETAIKDIIELKNNNDDWITWIVSSTGYSENDLQNMNNIAYNLGVGFVKIDSSSQLQNYINSQNVNIWELSEQRINDPIEKVSFFSHGIYKNNAGSVELGYNQANQSDLSINKKVVQGMFKEAFHYPNTIFYTCNSSTGDESSIAYIWKDTLGGFATGYVGKIDYSYIMYPSDYSSFKKIYSAKMRSIDKSIDKAREKYGFCESGSYRYPVPSKGTTLKTY